MDLKVIVILLACLQLAQSLFVPKSSKRDFRKRPKADSKYSDLLRQMAVIKLRLESLGYGPAYIEGPFDETRGAIQGKSFQDNDAASTISSADGSDSNPPSYFNEMEILELVPVIIEQKRKGNVSPEEEATLKEIFGDLWIVIEEEVNRAEGEEMNPILKALLQSPDNRLKRALVQRDDSESTGLLEEDYEQNDIYGNGVDRVRVTRWPKAFVDVDTAELSPQQRLMRHAAVLIRQWFDENSAPIVRAKKNSIRQRKLSRRARNQLRRRGGSGGGRGGGGGGKRNSKGRRNAAGGRKNRRGGRRVVKKDGQPEGGLVRQKRHYDMDDMQFYVDDNQIHDYDDEISLEEIYNTDELWEKPRSMRNSVRELFRLEEEEDYEDYDSVDDDY